MSLRTCSFCGCRSPICCSPVGFFYLPRFPDAFRPLCQEKVEIETVHPKSSKVYQVLTIFYVIAQYLEPAQKPLGFPQIWHFNSLPCHLWSLVVGYKFKQNGRERSGGTENGTESLGKSETA